MCEAATIAYAVVAVVAVVGGYMQYDASKKAQAYNEQVADNNTKIAEFRAIDTERLGQVEANERRLKTRLQIGQQVTGFAAQNVEASGTALAILGDTEMFGQIDEERIRGNAQRRAWGYRMEGQGYQTQSTLDSFTAKAGRSGTILSTVGSVAGAYGNSNGFGFGGGAGAGANAGSGSGSGGVGRFNYPQG